MVYKVESRLLSVSRHGRCTRSPLHRPLVRIDPSSRLPDGGLNGGRRYVLLTRTASGRDRGVTLLLLLLLGNRNPNRHTAPRSKGRVGCSRVLLRLLRLLQPCSLRLLQRRRRGLLHLLLLLGIVEGRCNGW